MAFLRSRPVYRQTAGCPVLQWCHIKQVSFHLSSLCCKSPQIYHTFDLLSQRDRSCLLRHVTSPEDPIWMSMPSQPHKGQPTENSLLHKELGNGQHGRWVPQTERHGPSSGLFERWRQQQYLDLRFHWWCSPWFGFGWPVPGKDALWWYVRLIILNCVVLSKHHFILPSPFFWQVFYVILQFYSPTPKIVTIYRQLTENSGWERWQMYAEDCMLAFGMENNGQLSSANSVNCLQFET